MLRIELAPQVGGPHKTPEAEAVKKVAAARHRHRVKDITLDIGLNVENLYLTPRSGRTWRASAFDTTAPPGENRLDYRDYAQGAEVQAGSARRGGSEVVLWSLGRRTGSEGWSHKRGPSSRALFLDDLVRRRKVGRSGRRGDPQTRPLRTVCRRSRPSRSQERHPWKPLLAPTCPK